MRRFGSSPETRAIAPATLQAALLGAVLLAASFLIARVIFAHADPHDLWLASALLSLVFGFIFGGLGIGLALMLAGVPIARAAGEWLEGRSGMAIALAASLACTAGIYALTVEKPFAPTQEAIFPFVTLCFALPAALLYRRQVLLERGFERP